MEERRANEKKEEFCLFILKQSPAKETLHLFESPKMKSNKDRIDSKTGYKAGIH